MHLAEAKQARQSSRHIAGLLEAIVGTCFLYIPLPNGSFDTAGAAGDPRHGQPPAGYFSGGARGGVRIFSFGRDLVKSGPSENPSISLCSFIPWLGLKEVES